MKLRQADISKSTKGIDFLPDISGKRMLTTGGHFAYLKIAEGCDKHCTYCIIPKLRGSYRSVPMEQLVKEILSISKLEMNTMSHTELLSLSNILKRVYKHLIPLANEKHIRIQKNISEDVMMMGNELLLEKAVHNIISNAIRHSPVGAELGLELSFDSLLVRNSGVNIPDEDLDKLFTPFYCVEKSHNKLTGGSGLGLYLVKIILEQHGLSYTIENRQDSVCFKITLNSHNLN